MPRMGLTPEKVVIAAAELADEQGLPAATLSALAQNLGVRVPSLYKHIASLEDLQVRLALFAAAHLADALENAVTGKNGRDALLAFCTAYRRFAAAHPGQFQALVISVLTADQRQQADVPVEAILSKIMDDYGQYGADSGHGVRNVRSALTGFAVLEAAGSFAQGEDAESSFYALAAQLDRGLAANNSTGNGSPRRIGFRLPGIPGLPALPIPGR